MNVTQDARARIAAVLARSTRRTEDILSAWRAGHVTMAEREQSMRLERAVADAQIRQARRGAAR